MINCQRLTQRDQEIPLLNFFLYLPLKCYKNKKRNGKYKNTNAILLPLSIQSCLFCHICLWKKQILLPSQNQKKQTIVYNINHSKIAMSQECCVIKEGEMMKQGHNGHSGKKSRNCVDRQRKAIFSNQVSSQVVYEKFSDYCEGLKENKLIKSFQFQAGPKTYIFDKILPIEKSNFSLQNSIQKAYLIPSEIFTVMSPIFLNGLQSYVKSHPSYQKEKEIYIQNKSKQKGIKNTKVNQEEVSQMEPYSEMEEDFIAEFLQRYTEKDQSLKQLVYSVLRFNYFSVSDFSKNSILLQQLSKQAKIKYSSFYQLYLLGNKLVKKYIISQIIGQQSYIGRYSQLYSTPFIQTPFCIKYQGNYVAMVYIRRLNPEEYSKKIKIKSLVSSLKEKGIEEVMYVYTLYVLPKYKGMSHGSNILNILKLSELPIVLCSSASSELSGLSDKVGNSYFYKKCQFKEYFPLEVNQEEDQLDQGCLLRNQQHTECQVNHCLHPKKAYEDQSYYVYCPELN